MTLPKLDSVLSRAGWLIVVTCALTLSAYSLYWVARSYGLPPPLAGIVSASFDGAALVLADLSLKYARTHGDSGLGARAGVLVLAGASAYLNMQHAIILHDPVAARVLYMAPPVTAVALFELHTRYERRGALRRAGRIPASLPSFGRWAWFLFPLRTLAVLRRVIEYRLELAETGATVSGSITNSTETTLRVNGTADQRAVRVWARLQGIEIGDRGPIPQEITKAYAKTVSHVNGSS